VVAGFCKSTALTTLYSLVVLAADVKSGIFHDSIELDA